jgi:hypothetical protein
MQGCLALDIQGNLAMLPATEHDAHEGKMNLVAKTVCEYANQRTGVAWGKKWQLTDLDSNKTYGELMWNSLWGTQKFCVSILNPVHPELGLHSYTLFEDRTVALKWAREQIEGLPSVTCELIDAAIQRVKDSRYQDEMSDDYAYSNGKVAHWNKLQRELENQLKTLG